MSPKYSELLNDTRLNILEAIYSGKHAFADIADQLPQSKPEVSRHLSRLVDQGLVVKNEEYTITDLGELIIKIVSPLDPIIQYFDFFQNHSLTRLPLEIVRNLDLLHDIELIHGTGYILNKMEEISKIDTYEIRIIMDQPFPDFRNDLVLSGIFILPTRMKEHPQLEDEFKHKYSNYQVRTLPTIHYPMGIINEEYGFLFLPDYEGIPDYNFCVFSSDRDAILFMQKIWKHYWDEAKPLFYRQYSQS